MHYNTQTAVVVRIRITTIIVVVSLILSTTLVLVLPQAAHAKLSDRLRSASAPLSVQRKKVSHRPGRSHASLLSPSQSHASVVNSMTEPTESSTSDTASEEPAPVVAVASSPTSSSTTTAIAPRETVDLHSLRLAALMTPLSLADTPRTVVTAATASQASFIPLHTSDKGWEFFGVAWYWWVIEGALVAAAIAWKRRVA